MWTNLWVHYCAFEFNTTFKSKYCIPIMTTLIVSLWELQKKGIRDKMIFTVMLSCGETFLWFLRAQIPPLSWLSTSSLTIFIWNDMSHSLHVNNANSQVLGQKLRRSNHTSVKKKENNIKCFSFLFLFLCLLPYHRNVHLCPPLCDSKRASECPQCWIVWSSAQLPMCWLICISQLSTWI